MLSPNEGEVKQNSTVEKQLDNSCRGADGRTSSCITLTPTLPRAWPLGHTAPSPSARWVSRRPVPPTPGPAPPALCSHPARLPCPPFWRRRGVQQAAGRDTLERCGLNERRPADSRVTLLPSTRRPPRKPSESLLRDLSLTLPPRPT